MLISNKTRIRNCGKYLSHIEEGTTSYIGLPITEDIASKLQEIGFNELNTGETLVPSPKLGPIARFNANGKEIPQRDLPMETAYRQQYWEWEDWGGNHHSRTVDIPFKRYPRKLIDPPCIELTIIQSKEKKFVIAGQSFIKGQTPEEDILHQINLMLGIFRSAEILSENLEQYEIPRIRRLNWELLPSGNMPWEQFKQHLEPVLFKKSKGKKMIIAERLETVSAYKPDFHAIGTNGYHGYIVFGFSQMNLYIFETAEYGNATYVFEGNWEEVSRMTKSEILTGNRCKHRFIHRDGWKKQIESLFPKGKQMIS